MWGFILEGESVIYNNCNKDDNNDDDDDDDDDKDNNNSNDNVDRAPSALSHTSGHDGGDDKGGEAVRCTKKANRRKKQGSSAANTDSTAASISAPLQRKDRRLVKSKHQQKSAEAIKALTESRAAKEKRKQNASARTSPPLSNLPSTSTSAIGEPHEPEAIVLSSDDEVPSTPEQLRLKMEQSNNSNSLCKQLSADLHEQRQIAKRPRPKAPRARLFPDD